MRMVYVQYVIWIYGRIGRGGSSTFEIGTRRIIHGTNYSMTRPTGRHLGKLRAELAVVSSTQGTHHLRILVSVYPRHYKDRSF